MRFEPTRLELLELSIDTHMVDLWREAEDVESWDMEVAAAFMRAAFGMGYMVAYREPEHGEFAREHGYVVPVRRAA